MKFLCIPCDEPMKLADKSVDDRGSIALTYECPKCSRGTAMLTNPFETQVVTSMGVKIGPAASTGAASSASSGASSSAPSSAPSSDASSGAASDASAAVSAANGSPGPAGDDGQGAGATPSAAASMFGGGDISKCPFSDIVQGMQSEAAAPPDAFPWTPEAAKRLENIPDFVRPMARTGIEKFARDRGLDRVDENILDEARDFFGM